jgi:hypothetical protein
MIKRKITKTKNYKFVAITKKSYGANLQGIKIYYEGKRPTGLKDDGGFSLAKNILEILVENFNRFKWVITQKTDNITKQASTYIIKTSIKTIRQIYSQSIYRTRDIKTEIIQNTFLDIYPKKSFKTFLKPSKTTYNPDDIANILDVKILDKLSVKDKEAINLFLPDYLTKESVNTVNIIKASTQKKTLLEIASEINLEMSKNHTESWWQAYIQRNILLIQQGYLHAIEKMNISIGKTKFPDFSLVTFDGFLDILEIKKPSTPLVKYDEGRDNYYWDNEISKAIIQVENYLENIQHHADPVRSYIKDYHSIELKVIRPRGIILCGDYSTLENQKSQDDFRLLSLSLKNINVLTYSELVQRLKNYINVLNRYSKSK